MGFLDFFKRKEKNNVLQMPPTMSGALPMFSSFGDNIYASDIVMQSIRCKANEFKKLDPRHIRYMDGKPVSVYDSTISRALREPNELMTTADFLEKITIFLELNKNVYIYPMFYTTQAGERYYTGLYPLKPSEVTYLTDEQGKLFINFQFASGYQTTLPADDVVHWRKDYGVNDYFGGGMFGGNDDSGLLKVLTEYDKLLQSIAKGLDIACKINGIIKYNSYHGGEELDAQLADFQERLRNNESGLLATDLSIEYTPIARDVKFVDKETLDFLYQNILRANGTSLAILNGDYTTTQKAAYYEHALEADIKSLGQAFTKKVFTEREKAFGNEISFYPNEINFWSVENKIAVIDKTLPAGVLMKDEVRELLGYPPLPNGMGQVVAQGYNSLLDSNNKNTLQNNDDEVKNNE